MAVDLSQLTWASRHEIEIRQNVIREAVQERFGQIPPEVEAAVEKSADTDEELRALFRLAITVPTLSALLEAIR